MKEWMKAETNTFLESAVQPKIDETLRSVASKDDEVNRLRDSISKLSQDFAKGETSSQHKIHDLQAMEVKLANAPDMDQFTAYV